MWLVPSSDFSLTRQQFLASASYISYLKVSHAICLLISTYFVEPSPLHTTTIVEKCTLKLVDEYKHMLCQATEPLSTFLEYITYVEFLVCKLLLYFQCPLLFCCPLIILNSQLDEIFTQIWSHDWQCCPHCYWNLAWERCSGTVGEVPPFGHVWQVLSTDNFCISILLHVAWYFLPKKKKCVSYPEIDGIIKCSHLFFFLLFASIATLAVAQNMRELYRLVLVDTPLAPYFSECITSEV